MNETSVENRSQIQQGVDQSSTDKKGIFAYNRYGLGLFAFLLVMLFLGTAIKKVAVMIFGVGVLDSIWMGMGLGYACMYLVGFPLMLLVMRKVPKVEATRAPRKKLSVLHIIGLYSILYTVMTLLAMLSGMFEQLIGRSGTMTVTDMLDSTNTWILFVCGVFIAPIMEEVLFRKIGYERVAAYGGGLYIVWTAILFGLLHMNFGQTIYATVIGLILAKITYETGTAKYSMILHVMVNLSGGVGLTGLVMRTGDQNLLLTYSWILTGVMLLGLISIVVFFVKYRGVLKNAPSTTPMKNKKMAFLNVGTILYIATTVGMIVWGFFPA